MPHFKLCNDHASTILTIDNVERMIFVLMVQIPQLWVQHNWWGWFYIFRGGVLFCFVPQESHGQAGSYGGNRFWTLSHLFDSGRKDVAPESVRQNQWGGSQLATLASTPSEPSWELPQWEESLEKCGYLDCMSPYLYCNQKWKFTKQNGVLTQDSWGHRCTPQCCIVQCSVLEHCASPYH